MNGLRCPLGCVAAGSQQLGWGSQKLSRAFSLPSPLSQSKLINYLPKERVSGTSHSGRVWEKLPDGPRAQRRVAERPGGEFGVKEACTDENPQKPSTPGDAHVVATSAALPLSTHRHPSGPWHRCPGSVRGALAPVPSLCDPGRLYTCIQDGSWKPGTRLDQWLLRPGDSSCQSQAGLIRADPGVCSGALERRLVLFLEYQNG